MSSIKGVVDEATALNGLPEESGRNASGNFNSAEPAFESIDSKQSLSTYLTIAASAFGLISDGCEYCNDHDAPTDPYSYYAPSGQ